MLGESISFSLLSVENNSNPAPKKIMEVKDSWAAVTVTLDMVPAGRVMLVEHIDEIRCSKRRGSQGSGEKTFSLKSNQATHRRIIFWGVSVVKLCISKRKDVHTGLVFR